MPSNVAETRMNLCAQREAAIDEECLMLTSYWRIVYTVTLSYSTTRAVTG
jgi:hypothetical protein